MNLNKISGVQTELAKDAIAKIRSFMLMGDEGKASVMSSFEKQLKLFALLVIRMSLMPIALTLEICDARK